MDKKMYFKSLILILTLCSSAVQSDEIIKIADPRVKAVPIQESHEPLVDLGNPAINPRHSKIRLMPTKDKANAGFYRAPHPDCFKVRKGLFKALQKMVANLPENIGIYVYEAYRPLSVQKQYFDKVYNEIKEKNSNLSDEEIFQKTSTMVSPVLNNIPPHCTGSAIDMTLINLKTNVPLDMGKLGVLSGKNEVMETHSNKITELQRQNRALLLQAASKAGLVNYPMEWWHYSIGDRYAAYLLGAKYAIYGIVPLVP